MLKLPSRELSNLIDQVLAKRKWTQERLAKEMDVRPEALSRWRAGKGIHKRHHAELLRLASDEEIRELLPAPQKLSIPFHVTIPRKYLKIGLDQEGNITIDGLLMAALDKEI